MRFKDIPGHEDVKRLLREMADRGRLPHALLLEGPEGSAKFALARAFAQYIHCTDRHDGDSCGVCPACRQAESFRHIDTLFSFPVVKASGTTKATVSDDYLPEFISFVQENPWMDFDNWMHALGDPKTLPQIYVDEGVELIRRLGYTAQSSRYKIVLMWLPERMKEETANKMLKVVEEPHPDTVFIMTSDEPQRILPTIYSRVQRIKVHALEPTVVAGWLMSHGVSDEIAAKDAAVLSEGSLNRALRIVSVKGENREFLELFIQLMRLAYQRNILGLRNWSEQVAGMTRDKQIKFATYCGRLIRENFVYNLPGHELNRLTVEEKAFTANFARFITARNVEQMSDLFSDAIVDIAGNANGKIVFFDLALKVFLYLR